MLGINLKINDMASVLKTTKLSLRRDMLKERLESYIMFMN